MTLNEIKSKLTGFFSSHAQVNSTFYGDEYDLAAEEDVLYPAANIEYNGATTDGRKMNHSYTITIGDVSDENVKGIEDDLLSDLTQIAQDLFAYLGNTYDFEFSGSSRITKWTDQGKDRLTAIKFDVTLSVMNTSNECSTPKRDKFVAYFAEAESLDEIDSIEELQEKTIEAWDHASVDYGQDVRVERLYNPYPKYVFMAEPKTEPVKTRWFNSAFNQGDIGLDVGDLFGPPAIVGRWRVYASTYRTQAMTIEFKKQ